jgi:hypothetical protein
MGQVRQSYAHEVELSGAGLDEEGAPGGAVTDELCGSLDHEPPCPLAAHFTSVVRRDEGLDVRVLFACEPADEPAVRSRIDSALGRSWDVVRSAAAEVRDEEAGHAGRLATS